MKKWFFIFLLPAITLLQCSSPSEKTEVLKPGAASLPRVLFITSGISDRERELAQGIVVAIQSFNKAGVPVRLEPRDILYNYTRLSSFNIIIFSTYEGYHDGDRKYSLSYMSDEEIHNLTRFVEEGGVLISGENVGRNYIDGTDRISAFNELSKENWELSKCFGTTFAEKNVTASSVKGVIPGFFNWETPASSASGEEQERWLLVPGKIVSEKSNVLAYWKTGLDSSAAMIENYYGKGIAFSLPFSSLLQPVNDGGSWSADQISKFYAYVLLQYNTLKGINIRLNPWPSGYDYAFCVSLNAAGNTEQYERVFNFLESEKIEPILFVSGLVDLKIKSFIEKKGITLASNGFSYSSFNDLKYPQAVDDILRNEDYWGVDFHGFRFPYTRPGYWGLLALDEHDYTFESSISANNIDFFHGSVVPYNIVMANDGFYKSTDIIEIAPTYHDDYYFLNKIREGAEPDSLQLIKDVTIYGKYLESYWQHAVKPYNGLMVFLGHPLYAGYSSLTLKPLQELVRTVKAEKTWITSMQEVARFREAICNMQFIVDTHRDKQQISVKAPAGISLSEVCLNVTGKVRKATANKGEVKVLDNPTGAQLIFNAFDGQVITVQY